MDELRLPRRWFHIWTQDRCRYLWSEDSLPHSTCQSRNQEAADREDDCCSGGNSAKGGRSVDILAMDSLGRSVDVDGVDESF